MFNHNDHHVTLAATAGGWAASVGIPINSWMRVWTKMLLLSFRKKSQLSETGRNAVIDRSGKYCRIIFLQVPDVKTTLLPRCKWRFLSSFLFCVSFVVSGLGLGGKLLIFAAFRSYSSVRIDSWSYIFIFLLLMKAEFFFFLTTLDHRNHKYLNLVNLFSDTG